MDTLQRRHSDTSLPSPVSVHSRSLLLATLQPIRPRADSAPNVLEHERIPVVRSICRDASAPLPVPTTSISTTTSDFSAGEMQYLATASPEEQHAYLHEAIGEGLIGRIRQLLGLGLRTDVCLAGRSPVSVAASTGNLAIVKLMLEAGFSPEFGGRGNYSPLQCAILGDHVEVVEFLLSIGVNYKSEVRSGETALMFAAQEGAVKSIECLAVRMESLDEEHKGKTALDHAISRGQDAAAARLLDLGADSSRVAAGGNTQLMLAAQKCGPATIAALIDDGLEIEARNDAGYSALDLAFDANKASNVAMLIDRGAAFEVKAPQYQAILHDGLASAKRNGKSVVAMVEVLCQQGISLAGVDWTRAPDAYTGDFLRMKLLAVPQHCTFAEPPVDVINDFFTYFSFEWDGSPEGQFHDRLMLLGNAGMSVLNVNLLVEILVLAATPQHRELVLTGNATSASGPQKLVYCASVLASTDLYKHRHDSRYAEHGLSNEAVQGMLALAHAEAEVLRELGEEAIDAIVIDYFKNTLVTRCSALMSADHAFDFATLETELVEQAGLWRPLAEVLVHAAEIALGWTGQEPAQQTVPAFLDNWKRAFQTCLQGTSGIEYQHRFAQAAELTVNRVCFTEYVQIQRRIIDGFFEQADTVVSVEEVQD